MNGMKAKAERKRLAKQFTKEGIPVDVNAWTQEDWRDLHEAMKRVKRKIAKRHRKTTVD